MSLRKRLLGLALGMPLAAISVSAIADVRPLLQEGKQTLHQRVLTTPGCRLAEQPDVSGGEVQPAFSRFYVYQRSQQDGEEWLEVGPDSYGGVSGWLPATCTVDWKMQLTLSFTNPANRDRLMFFDERDGLMTIFDDFEPSGQVAPLRAQLRRDGEAPGIVAQEPEYFVDLHEQFYLLPILEGEEIMTEAGFMTRLLRVASVSEADESETPDTPDATAQLREFNAGVVFVIDSTISMGPYIERTREAVERIYQRIEQEELTERVRFGLVSFRDSVDHAADIEYVTRMYADPNEVEDGSDFMAQVADLREAPGSTVGWEEDAYAGVMEAIDQVEWSNFGARYIVLITDASAIEGESERSATGLDADQVRLEAARHGIAVYTLHLKTPGGEQRGDHAVAESQYSNLSTFTGTGTSLYYPVDTGDVALFGQRVDALATAITDQVHAAYLGEEAIGSALHAEEEVADPGQQRLRDELELIGHAMRLAYLGQATGSQAPPVFEAWISDRDLIAQHVPTTEVRVLLTKGQLSDLSDVVSEILDAANAGLISPTDMFERLRSVAAAMGADPNQLQHGEGQRLGELGLMGEYLEDLPYQSEVLNLDEETWLSWDGLQQERFIRRLATKLRHYQRYNEDVDRWVALAEGADPREDVYPVPLEMMP